MTFHVSKLLIVDIILMSYLYDLLSKETILPRYVITSNKFIAI